MSNDTIINRGGKLSTVTGRGVIALRLKAIILALEFKQKTGFEIDRRFPALKTAKQTTGLKTNKIDAQIEELKRLFNIEVEACEVTNEG